MATLNNEQNRNLDSGLTKEQTIEIFKEVAHLEYEFNNYKKFSVIQGSKQDGK